MFMQTNIKRERKGKNKIQIKCIKFILLSTHFILKQRTSDLGSSAEPLKYRYLKE